jgi:hypothetical protein
MELAGLARRLGAAPANVDKITRAFQTRRGAFLDPIDVRGLDGMDAALFAALEPYLTVHGDGAAAIYAPPALLAVRNPPDRDAIAAARAEGLPAPRNAALKRYALFLDIAADDGARRAEQVVIETPGPDSPYQILSRRRLTPGTVTALFEAGS